MAVAVVLLATGVLVVTGDPHEAQRASTAPGTVWLGSIRQGALFQVNGATGDVTATVPTTLGAGTRFDTLQVGASALAVRREDATLVRASSATLERGGPVKISDGPLDRITADSKRAYVSQGRSLYVVDVSANSLARSAPITLEIAIDDMVVDAEGTLWTLDGRRGMVTPHRDGQQGSDLALGRAARSASLALAGGRLAVVATGPAAVALLGDGGLRWLCGAELAAAERLLAATDGGAAAGLAVLDAASHRLVLVDDGGRCRVAGLPDLRAEEFGDPVTVGTVTLVPNYRDRTVLRVDWSGVDPLVDVVTPPDLAGTHFELVANGPYVLYHDAASDAAGVLLPRQRAITLSSPAAGPNDAVDITTAATPSGRPNPARPTIPTPTAPTTPLPTTNTVVGNGTTTTEATSTTAGPSTTDGGTATSGTGPPGPTTPTSPLAVRIDGPGRVAVGDEATFEVSITGAIGDTRVQWSVDGVGVGGPGRLARTWSEVGAHTIRVTVSDDRNVPATDEQLVDVVATDPGPLPNRPPVAGTIDVTMQAATTRTLSLVELGVSDPDGDPITIEVPPGGLPAGVSAAAVAGGLQISVDTTVRNRTVTYSVRDDRGATAEGSVRVQVTPAPLMTGLLVHWGTGVVYERGQVETITACWFPYLAWRTTSTDLSEIEYVSFDLGDGRTGRIDPPFLGFAVIGEPEYEIPGTYTISAVGHARDGTVVELANGPLTLQVTDPNVVISAPASVPVGAPAQIAISGDGGFCRGEWTVTYEFGDGASAQVVLPAGGRYFMDNVAAVTHTYATTGQKAVRATLRSGPAVVVVNGAIDVT